MNVSYVSFLIYKEEMEKSSVITDSGWFDDSVRARVFEGSTKLSEELKS